MVYYAIKPYNTMQYHAMPQNMEYYGSIVLHSHQVQMKLVDRCMGL